jgi:hypothetical protein
MAKWSDKMMAEGGSAAAQPMGLSVGANQPWGSVAGITVDTWNTCQYCNCKEGHLHDKFCPTQLRLREDNPADEPSCPTCKDGVCQCGPDNDPCPTCLYNVCKCGPDEDEGTEEFRSVFVKPEYSDLFEVLRDALEEAQEGKGAVRHGNGLSFMDQPALTITRAVGLGFPLGQAMKKIQESQRMDTDAAKRELLGAINYLAAAVLFLDE